MKLKVKHKIIFPLFIFAYLFLAVLLGFFYFKSLSGAEEELIYATEKIIYNAFLKVNGTMQDVERIIRDNSRFFEDYNQSVNNEQIIKVVQAVRELKIRDSYIEDVVFYKADHEHLITATGLISKSNFFDYAYYNNEFDPVFWDEIMSKYNTPTFIPLNDYTIEHKTVKRLFITPKIYPLYNIGVIIFIGENNFIDFFGINNIDAKIRLFDENGNLILSNNNDPITTRLQMDALKISPFTIQRSLFGNYAHHKWTEYENMIFSFEKRDLSFLWFCLLALLILMVMLILFQRGNKNVLFPAIDQKLSKRIFVMMAAKDKAFYLNHQLLANKILMLENNQHYWFVAILFLNSNWHHNQPSPLELEKVIKNKSIVLPLEENSYCALLTFSPKKEKAVRQNLLGALEQLTEAFGEDSKVQLVFGTPFDSLHHLHKEYHALFNQIGKAGFETQQPTKLIPELPASLKTTLYKYITTGDRKGLNTYLGNLIDENREANLSFNALYYLFIRLYHEMLSMIGSALEEEEFRQIDEMFYDGIKVNYNHLDFERMKNVLFNIGAYLIDLSENTKGKHSKKEISRFLEEHYASDLYLDLVAKKFDMAPRQFSYYFKKEFGMGLNEYITRLRLEEGERLLINTQLSVLEIGLRIGYQNSSAFIMAFKKQTGLTPGAFRSEKIKNKPN